LVAIVFSYSILSYACFYFTTCRVLLTLILLHSQSEFTYLLTCLPTLSCLRIDLLRVDRVDKPRTSLTHTHQQTMNSFPFPERTVY